MRARMEPFMELSRRERARRFGVLEVERDQKLMTVPTAG